MSVRRVAHFVVLAVVGAMAASLLLVACGSSSESSLPILEFSQFGDPAESLYCLP